MALVGIWTRKFLPVPWLLCGPRRYDSSSFKAADLQLEMTQEPHKKPDPSKPLLFGKTFTDHMLMVEWNREKGWGQPRIQPFQNLTLHPACSALHYSLQLFEGMKAFKGRDQCVRLFRPWLNMDRMLRSALRLCLPSFDKVELLQCIRRLVEVDKAWVPDSSGTSLYVRPVLIGNEGEFRVAERKITMKEFLQALEDGRVREVFGSGTACQVCPVHRILYQGKHLHIPTMENGPELILRFHKELKAIQYGTKAHEWMLPV
ncbi:Branched-chain-amino-acid aminotransferase, mitochondrial, partial [Eschrichtius robustus]|nr:Branched-chain-amino-acid aminotransferase, mitochondrial [Eschrichtius robustus]